MSCFSPAIPALGVIPAKAGIPQWGGRPDIILTIGAIAPWIDSRLRGNDSLFLLKGQHP